MERVSNGANSQRQPEGTLDLIEDEAFIIVKAAPRRSETYGETVCCAGLDRLGNWVRLYPVSFKLLSDAQRFKRWDHIRYRWSRPKASKDLRTESRRLDPNSVEILSELKQANRNPLVARCVVTSLKQEIEKGRSLALLKAEIVDFWHEKRPQDEIEKREKVLASLQAQDDLFVSPSLIPQRICPYSFKYRYRDDDTVHDGTCQDWETEQTFFARRRDLGSEKAALEWMAQMFGQQYPQRGMALAMGTHRYRTEQWLINGVVRLNEEPQLALL